MNIKNEAAPLRKKQPQNQQMLSPAELYEKFEVYRSQTHFPSEPNGLYDPIHYILELGGKRVRPLLVLMGCDLFGGNIEDAFPAAYAVELFHNFTLMHDDIMDNAPLRRGRPTVHVKFSASNAILSGDVMVIYAYKFLNDLKDEHLPKVLKLFNETAVRVCEGQQYDLDFQKLDFVSVEQYLRMIEFKTAVLLAVSLEAGACIAGANKKDAALIFQFGKNMGLCFQLMDDLLDSFGEEKLIGKKIGGDIAENKKTFLMIKALELATGEEKEKLKFYLQNNIPVDEKVKGVLEIYRHLKIEKITLAEIERFHHAAMESLDEISVDHERKQILRSFAKNLLHRNM